MANDFQLAGSEPTSQTPQPPLIWLTDWLSDKLEAKGQNKPWGMLSNAFCLLQVHLYGVLHFCLQWDDFDIHSVFTQLCVRPSCKSTVDLEDKHYRSSVHERITLCFDWCFVEITAKRKSQNVKTKWVKFYKVDADGCNQYIKKYLYCNKPKTNYLWRPLVLRILLFYCDFSNFFLNLQDKWISKLSLHKTKTHCHNTHTHTNCVYAVQEFLLFTYWPFVPVGAYENSSVNCDHWKVMK